MSKAESSTLTGLDELVDALKENQAHSLGYPVARDFDYTELASYLALSLNNVGDPFADGTYKVNSLEYEREVLRFFAKLTRAPEDDWWGYVTNGGSEGNLYGLYLARELYPDGIVYYSQDTHYSVAKNLHFLNMRHIMIRSTENGEIDYDDLKATINIRRDAPAIVFANIGTTMTEAKDDLGRIGEIFNDLAVEKHYLHSDAALCGGYAAFMDPKPAWDFADGADSISISGHKFIGSPIPCGIALARRRNVERIGRAVAYIGSMDTTISGSRSGLSPLILWLAIQRQGTAGFKSRLHKALALAQHAERRLRDAGIPAWRNPGALTVVFPKVPADIQRRWQLASAGGISHMICMPGVVAEQVDLLIDAMIEASKRGEYACESSR